MKLGLEGKVALITGSSRGIGRAIAEALAAEGCGIMLTGRDAAALEESTRAIAALGGKCGTHLAELREETAPAALVKRSNAISAGSTSSSTMPAPPSAAISSL